MLEPIPDQVLDIQHDPDPAQDHGPARRIPHLGHAFFFFSLSIMTYLLCAVAVLTAARIHPEQLMQHLGLGLLIQVLAYILTLVAAFWIFPYLWSKPFLTGIEWNALSATRRWFWIIPLGIVLSIAAQLADAHIPEIAKSPLDSFFTTPRDAWLLTACGVLLFPLFEEVAFRGFLLPALATAYDWLALDRTPAGLRRWETSSAHSTPALIFGTVFSSLGFAFIHGDQLSFSFGFMAVLFVVSLVLSWVRIRSHSVACSVLLHATYNLTTFATAFIASGGYRHLEKLSS
jgi:membrane protease YdiL (CAAX protease family)